MSIASALTGCVVGMVGGTILALASVIYIEKSPGTFECTEWTLPTKVNGLQKPVCANYHATKQSNVQETK